MTDREQLTRAAALPADHLTRLREAFRGDVILPNDDTYDDARQMHNPLHESRPALIVRPLDANDVALAVRFASDNDLTIAVRGGGHSGAGFGTVDDGIVINLSRMRAITIDPEARIARAQGGITAGEFTTAAIAHGMVTPFGDSPSVGVGGITTGGGVGWLTRKFGMTIDSLLAVEIVTADGRILNASETEHADLFWAVRGGGGNFGIVTTFEFRLHPISTVIGGTLFLPATRETIRGVIDLSQNASDDLTTISMLMKLPPMPGVPESAVGNLCLMVMPVWTGDLDAGEHALAPFRALAEPVADQLQPMPFSTMYELNGDIPAQYTAVNRSFLADSLDDAAVDAMLTYMDEPMLPPNSNFTIVQFRILGGAMARVPADATAFAHRDANLLVAVGAAMYDLPAHDDHVKWVESLFGAMRHTLTGAYLNFLEAEGEDRIREAYPAATYQRLAELKRRYDPENRFHRNQNIQPASA